MSTIGDELMHVDCLALTAALGVVLAILDALELVERSMIKEALDGMADGLPDEENQQPLKRSLRKVAHVLGGNGSLDELLH